MKDLSSDVLVIITLNGTASLIYSQEKIFKLEDY
jgi:hypothetical protein